jgi:recombinational DNA repair ATPase RecF
MNPDLHDTIFNRLVDDTDLDSEAQELVHAACLGAAALDAALHSGGDRRLQPPSQAERGATAARAFLRSLELGGFRGVGPALKLELTPGPGLTLITGRNGSGKSSIAEALETLLSGKCRRWASQPKEWQAGWRNLHDKGGAFVAATLCVEGVAEPTVLRRTWKPDTNLDQGELRVRRGSVRFERGLEELGWSEALATYFPLLSYADLATLVGDPSGLFDELKRILGLGDINAAIKLLGAARKERDERRERAKNALVPLLEELRSLAAAGDPRADACAAGLKGRKWDLDAVEAVVLAQAEDDAATLIATLRSLSQLSGPNLAQVASFVAALRAELAGEDELLGAGEDEAMALARLLDQALALIEGGACPLCEAPLVEGWRARTRSRLDHLTAHTKKTRERREAVARHARSVRALATAPPQSLHAAAQELAALDKPALVAAVNAAKAAWESLHAAPEGPSRAELERLCSHTEASVLELATALESLRAGANAELEHLESAWRPVARRLAAWLEQARVVVEEAASLRALKKAEKWLKDAEIAIRKELFKPIADRSQSIWNLLRHESNVDLASIQLESTGTRRRVSLDVRVDGEPGVALGVMSQGELNALALALFLPRMTLRQSPFHFVVIDDPVQAMDPHKVDGLARVLEETARERQVIVLTHDARLIEAVQRLAIDAHVLEVHRRAGSVLEIREALTPIARHLADARQCLHNEDKIGPTLAARIVPTFCRLALEAACSETIRRRRLGRGETQNDVEDVLGSADGIHPLIALAVFDDVDRTDRVFGYLNNKHGRRGGDTLKAVKEGAHGDRDLALSLRELIDHTRAIANILRTLPDTPVKA